MWRRPTRTQVSAAAWATRVRFKVGRELRRTRVDELELPLAPRLGLQATRGVRVALFLTKATCLERSLVFQSWYAAHDIARDVVIGVSLPKRGFRAHAWLEEPGQLTEHEYTEITRLPARLGASTTESGDVATNDGTEQTANADHATSPTGASEQIRLRGAGLEFVDVDGEVVVLDAQRSLYFSVNGTGSPLWAALRTGATEDDLERVLAEAYSLSPERAAADVTVFLDQLRAQGLLDDTAPSS
jgi:Coenzyme PQQ synthesis protein D (PqqD)/Transglutaminase-like superfamily